MASSAQQHHQTGGSFLTLKQEHRTGDSFITVNQQHQTGGRNPIITVKKEHRTGDSIITVNQQHQTRDSIITVKQEHRTGDVFISVKQEHQNDDSFIIVKVMNSFNRGYDFRIRRNEPLNQLVMRWRIREEMDKYHKFYLIVNGRAIYDNKTANDIGLKDGDCIRVMLLQTTEC